MIEWMLYSVIVGTLVTGAALAAESIARVFAKPVRWTWASALVLLMVLVALAPVRRTPVTTIVDTSAAAVSVDSFQWESQIVAAGQKLPSSTVLVIVGAWIALSVLLIAMMLAVHLRSRRACRTWPLADISGTRVRLSADTGPVVIGFRAPEIVVPRWLLDRKAEEQRLVIAHEAEHVVARDTWLLAAGYAAVALMPWNPAVWFAFSRLRLAVELDCDARVLRRGVAALSYGSLLIDVAAQASPLRFGAPALANSPSHLHRRIQAMTTNIPRFARLRASMIAVVGAAALLAACEATMPTAAEVEALDVRGAEKRLVLDASAAYVVDGKAVVRAEALELKPEDLASIEVVKDGSVSKLVITTKQALETEKVARRAGLIRLRGEIEQSLTAAPLLFIDGVRQDQSALKKLDRSQIESVEVIKGKAAATIYGDAAEHGVIVVKTKK